MGLERALKDHFGGDDGEENGADEGVQAEEGEVDPVQVALAGDPMFKDETAEDDDPADKIGDPKTAEEAKGDQ